MCVFSTFALELEDRQGRERWNGNRCVGGFMRAMSLHIGSPRMSGRSVSEPHSSFASLRRHYTLIFTASN